MRILLVEDDDRIAKPLAEDLRHQHHVVDVASDGIEGWHCTQAVAYDLILLDLMLPKLDGIALCQQLRSSQYKGFVLMLTALDTTTDKVMGLDAGADDYLVKPFELEELSARIRALSRRPVNLQKPHLRYGPLEINQTSHTVTYAGTVLNLTPKEYLILECFLGHPTQVFTRSMLLDKLWELEQISGENTIKTHITNLRQKLKAAGSNKATIQTVYGVGYRFVQDFE
ncbi:response regulator transcription factor [Merismopedia glauca]|uniref:DNA-binding response regulator n=1 Tax=Merismopedia glauca CCAP 1448/3 TaxID=1296344 RepID=A0A2T1C8X0_9CYAN|nr:response regulator transcription factor [Merismopedia glauca]PSB04608.1 DNA-binding response regulator [Merismopedia glauca CCAP 1448/3]